jgi:hypothetical protein
MKFCRPEAPLAYLPLKGGGRLASKSKPIGWGSYAQLDPHPNPPPFRGGERTESVREPVA